MTEGTVESIADSLTAAFNESSEPETEEEIEVSPEGASEEVEAESFDEVEAQEEDSEESEEPETVFQAPEHWSSDEREAFAALSPEAQELVLQRDKAFQTGYQEKAQAISAITDALEPWKESLAQRGVTADQAIRALFAAQHTLDANPIQGILQIARSYGVEDQLKSQFAPQADDDDFSDPEVKALKQEISALKNQISQTQQGFQQQSTAAVQRQIEDFSTAKDGSGELLHPHFEKVKADMAPYVQNGESMEAAYEKAVWANPEIRSELLAAQQRAQKEKSEQEKVQRVRKAKKASRGIRANGKADPEEGVENLNLHDQLADAFRQHSS